MVPREACIRSIPGGAGRLRADGSVEDDDSEVEIMDLQDQSDEFVEW